MSCYLIIISYLFIGLYFIFVLLLFLFSFFLFHLLYLLLVGLKAQILAPRHNAHFWTKLKAQFRPILHQQQAQAAAQLSPTRGPWLARPVRAPKAPSARLDRMHTSLPYVHATRPSSLAHLARPTQRQRPYTKLGALRHRDRHAMQHPAPARHSHNHAGAQPGRPWPSAQFTPTASTTSNPAYLAREYVA